MPELPEVETIVRQLAPQVRGRVLRDVEILDPRWSAPLDPEQLERALRGRRIAGLERRGKYLVWALQGGSFLVQHLRMSGVVLYEPLAEPAHTRVRMKLGPRAHAARARRAGRAGGADSLLLVSDPRRFGTARLLASEHELERFFAARLGIEPLDERFTAERLRALTRSRRAPVKAVLLDQRSIAGVGSIYADEALFRARVHPARTASRLTLAQCARLREGLIAALCAGIDAKGASIDDFRHVDGARGSFQDRFLVHRRAGCPCPRCGRTIVKRVVAGRGTYVCERCQPPPRGRVRRPAASRARRSGARRASPGSPR
jgi:formamidopyrimidine-DNA glycosylase